MIIRIEKKIRIRLLLWLYFPISLISPTIPFFITKIILPSTSSNFLFISLFLFHIVACSSFPLIFPNLSSPLLSFISLSLSLFSSPLLSSYLFSHLVRLISPLVHLSISVLSSLFPFPLSALPVPRVQELTLASLTCPLLGALRAAIGIKYSFISFITFILIRLSLNKSLIEPYY